MKKIARRPKGETAGFYVALRVIVAAMVMMFVLIIVRDAITEAPANESAVLWWGKEVALSLALITLGAVLCCFRSQPGIVTIPPLKELVQ